MSTELKTVRRVRKVHDQVQAAERVIDGRIRRPLSDVPDLYPWRVRLAGATDAPTVYVYRGYLRIQHLWNAANEVTSWYQELQPGSGNEWSFPAVSVDFFFPKCVALLFTRADTSSKWVVSSAPEIQMIDHLFQNSGQPLAESMLRRWVVIADLVNAGDGTVTVLQRVFGDITFVTPHPWTPYTTLTLCVSATALGHFNGSGLGTGFWSGWAIADSRNGTLNMSSAAPAGTFYAQWILYTSFAY